MSQIYQNTFSGVALGFAAKSITASKLIHTELGQAPLLLLAGINLIDLLYNRGYSAHSVFQTDKVFYSATLQWLPACNVTKTELNYVDLTAKGLSIALGLLSFVPKCDFISNNSLLFTLLPATSALIVEKCLDIAEVEYAFNKTWVQDCSGHYMYFEE